MSDGARRRGARIPLAPVAAAAAVVGAATALSGVLAGGQWLAFVTVAAAVVAASGMALRALRLPALGVAVGQMVALCCLLTGLFAQHAVLVVLPSPAVAGELQELLRQSVEQVRTGVPPVASTPAMMCLVTVAVGLVAIVVDTLAVEAEAPAASGLVLLCVFAVPASLADELLPWWSFVLGALGFAVLLAADGQHRHQEWRGRVGASGGGRSGVAPTATAIGGLSVVVALLVGSSMTFVGTAGRLPGADAEGGGDGSTGIGLQPFTSLRGQLDRGRRVELFRVRGLDESRYLRAMTLRRFEPGRGWVLDGVGEGVPVRGALPAREPRPPGSRVVAVDIEPLGYRDYWLPVYGVPLALPELDGSWRYDSTAGAVFSQRNQRPERYVEQAVLTNPSPEQLRGLPSGATSVDPAYVERPEVDQKVVDLARRITLDARSDFDKALALQDYFVTPANGFRYSLQTAGVGGDALTDFLFHGRAGYCEQYASAMAVMLRALDVPSRVAVGFTAGTSAGDHRVITTDDAHAWVEVYFPGQGWTMFDPTPLDNDRRATPPHLGTGAPTTSGTPAPTTTGAAPTSSAAPSGTSGARPSTTPGPVGQRAGDRAAVSAPPPPVRYSLSGLLGVLGALALLLPVVLAVVATRAARGTRAGSATGSPTVVSARAGGPASWALGGALLVFAALAGLAPASWWPPVFVWSLLTALLVALALGALPSVLRDAQRRARLGAVAAGGPGATEAAWQELLAESWDRGAAVSGSDTVRGAARKLAREHRLDEAGQRALRVVITTVERDWYGGQPSSGQELPAAVGEVRESLRRNAPLALRAKILPRSVLRPRGRPNDG
ncbi:transglutaminaseTgpA domain-containing protein [Streptoalloteichus tenebrarius]|uniref:transglutaminaseTgpA domain-containing protein n=1 Tax=Streptoalloteichus tenebrarius (strain ATCC 17920 / DSM 40477 / JCM 4838 / CBS 697.72 / NBRC 16177 / NCIMB 11028 / NRRL B-12390 / A12253. 1 / ISP 5477) TaxID=1933 RepID=UPI0035EA29A4